MSAGEALPTNPTDLRLLVQALADGELDAATSLALERCMAEDPALAAEYARIVALKAVFARLPRPRVSKEFQARIAALAGESNGAVPPATHRFRSYDWRALAASILLTAIVASGTTYWVTLRGAPKDFVGEIASSHQRSLLAASPVDIASSDSHTVKPWLDAKIGMSPPTVDLSKDGYALIGGRVEVIGNKPVPALVYRLRKHLITLIAVPQETDTTAPQAAMDVSTGGFSVVHWSDRKFSYWAISDIGRAELDAFAASFRAAATAG